MLLLERSEVSHVPGQQGKFSSTFQQEPQDLILGDQEYYHFQ